MTSEVGNDVPRSSCFEEELNLYLRAKNTKTRELEADNGFVLSFVTSVHVNVRDF